MTAVGKIQAGSRITASMLRGIAPLAVIKGADQSVTGSALQNDGELLVALAASTAWVFECVLDYEGGTQGSSDLQWGWTYPAGLTMRYSQANITTGGAVSFTMATETMTRTAGTNGAGNLLAVRMSGSVIVGSAAGTLQLQWARNTGSGTATIVHAQSSLTLWQQS